MDATRPVAAALLLLASASSYADPKRHDHASPESALLSIYVYARAGSKTLPNGPPTMAIEEAVSILMRSDAPFAPSRRRQAAARLAASNRTAFDSEIRTLAGPERVETLEKLDKRAAWVVKDQDGSRVGLETLYSNGLSAVSAADCPWKLVHDPDRTHVDHRTGGSSTIIVELQIEVPNDPPPPQETPLRVVARGLDPQSWDECSAFFDPTECTFLAGHESAACNQDLAPPKGPGDPLPPTDLFEQFEAKSSVMSMTVRNILEVQAGGDDNKDYWTSYELDKAISASVTGAPGVKLTWDHGSLEATYGQAGGKRTVDVVSKKTIAWDDKLVNDGTNMTFEALADAMAGEAYAIACCKLPRTPGGQ